MFTDTAVRPFLVPAESIRRYHHKVDVVVVDTDSQLHIVTCLEEAFVRNRIILFGEAVQVKGAKGLLVDPVVKDIYETHDGDKRCPITVLPTISDKPYLIVSEDMDEVGQDALVLLSHSEREGVYRLLQNTFATSH